MFFILGFSQGLTAEFSIITATCFGAGDKQGVRHSYIASIILSLLMTMVITILSVVFARPILEIMHTPPEIIEGAYNYNFLGYYSFNVI